MSPLPRVGRKQAHRVDLDTGERALMAEGSSPEGIRQPPEMVDGTLWGRPAHDEEEGKRPGRVRRGGAR
jgi:hypothetical protein